MTIDRNNIEEVESGLLKGVRLLRPLFDALDLTAFRMRKGKMLEAAFTDCRFDRADASESYLPASQFIQCTICNSLFTHAYLRGATFRKCVFESTDFTGSTFSEARFDDCVVINCRFDQAEFSDSSIDGLKIQDSTFFLADFTRVQALHISPIRQAIRGALLPSGV